MGMGRGAIGVVMMGLVSACVATPAVSPRPMPAPVAPVAPVQPAAVSPESAAAHAYYSQVQQALLSQGLLRTDGGGADTPYTDRMLAETFIQIALRDEYQPGTGGMVASNGGATMLRRWQGPVRVGLRFGASVPADVQATDRARVASYLARLAQVTGHSIRLDDGNPNYFLYIVNEDERRALGPELQAALPGLGAADVAGITQMPQSTYCAVLAQSRGQGGVYSRAFAVVRAEHPDLLRLSCIHEEIAQGLGLPNDSPRARPSIFNDDEEFALLTRMDEDMLRILYNPALRPGMTEAEARPIIFDLATRLTGGAS
ncbi:MAG: DUF2927 domain-containing protein [Pseudorhodobacter sp.]|nr:MAG: DUF2927 domain-containing protein [Pseudorhodobacter sp.]